MKRLLNNKMFWELIVSIPILAITLGINILIVIALIKFIWG